MKSFLNEFKKFISRGNVIELAVGIVIGGAFTKITNSLVEDILMPPIGFIISGINFSGIKIVLKESYFTESGNLVPAVSINIGNFIQILINFFIIAFALFFVIKIFNKIKEIQILQTEKIEKESNLLKISKQEELLTEIRDILLKTQKDFKNK